MVLTCMCVLSPCVFAAACTHNAAGLSGGSSIHSLHTLPLRMGSRTKLCHRKSRKLLLPYLQVAPVLGLVRRVCMTNELPNSSQKTVETTLWHKGSS